MSTGHPDVRFIHDGEWALIGRPLTRLAVYPREETGKFAIGRPAGVGTYRDVEGQSDFENMDAAIDHAVWLVNDGSDILQRLG